MRNLACKTFGTVNTQYSVAGALTVIDVLALAFEKNIAIYVWWSESAAIYSNTERVLA